MKLRLAIVALSLSFVPSQASLAADAVGVWLTDEGKAKVRLSECGGDRLCSEIIWLRQPNDENGRPLRDLYNPDPRMRSRPIMGLEILQNLTPAGPGQWQGQIYNPENGKIYTAHLTAGRQELRLKGCVSWGWPCGEQTWVRVKDNAQVAKAQPQARQQAPQAAAPQPQAQASAQAAAPLPWAAQPAQAQPSRSTTALAATGAVAPSPQPAQRQPAPLQQQVARAQPTPPPAALAPRRSSGEDYLVQIAARQTENEARHAFSELQRQFPHLLGSYQPTILMADLGPRGVWYRVGVGPIDEKGAASAFCEQLKSAGGDCIVRRQE